MAKYLYLLRHATAEDHAAAVKDFERELTPSGSRDAVRMGMHLAKLALPLQKIVTSPAERAKATAELVHEQLKLNAEVLEFNEDIYDASARTLMNIIHEWDDRLDHVMMVGHNPGFSYLAEYLTKKEVGDLAKGSVIALKSEGNSWKDLGEGSTTIAFYYKPDEIA